MNGRTTHLETDMFDAYIPWNMNALVATYLKVTWTKASVVSFTDLIRIGGHSDEASRRSAPLPTPEVNPPRNRARPLTGEYGLLKNKKFMQLP